MHTYTFAITFSDQSVWYTFTGIINDIEVLMQTLMETIPTTIEIRFNLRPLCPHRVPYSSICLFTQEPVDKMESKITRVLREISPLKENLDYLLRPMEIYKDRAYIVYDQQLPVWLAVFHNQWFSIPTNHQLEFEYDESLDFPYYTIIYQYKDNILKKYRGNNTHKSWLVMKCNNGRLYLYDNHYYTMDNVQYLVI